MTDMSGMFGMTAAQKNTEILQECRGMLEEVKDMLQLQTSSSKSTKEERANEKPKDSSYGVSYLLKTEPAITKEAKEILLNNNVFVAAMDLELATVISRRSTPLCIYSKKQPMFYWDSMDMQFVIDVASNQGLIFSDKIKQLLADREFWIKKYLDLYNSISKQFDLTDTYEEIVIK